MQNQTALIFRERFELAYKQSGIDSFSQLSRKAGLSRPNTQKIISGTFDHSKIGPGLFSVKRLADALNTTVGFLLSEDLASDPQAKDFFNGTKNGKDLPKELMQIHWRGAGRYEAFSSVLEDCDVYALPQDDSDTPQIIRVGNRTLLSGRLGGPFKRDAQRELNAMPEEVRSNVIAFQRRVVSETTAIGNTSLNHLMVTRNARVSASNTRTGLLVEDSKGKQSILLHASPIPV